MITHTLLRRFDGKPVLANGRIVFLGNGVLMSEMAIFLLDDESAVFRSWHDPAIFLSNLELVARHSIGHQLVYDEFYPALVAYNDRRMTKLADAEAKRNSRD
jgi:hypothetical protein